MSVPRVSVVVPMFNAAATVEASLRSLQGQCLRSIEVLVVDDGSTDGGPSLVRSMSEADPRIRLVQQPNSGVSAARNRATLEAQGDYLYWLDPDDLCMDGALRALTQAADHSGSGAAVGHHDVVNTDGQSLHEYRIPSARLGLSELIDGWSTRCGSHVVRRELVMTEDGPMEWDPLLTLWEDRDYWLRLGERGVNWAVVDRVVTRYVVTPGSLSKRAIGMMHAGDRVLRSVFARHLGEVGFEDERRDWLLAKNALSSASRAAVISGDGEIAAQELNAECENWAWSPCEVVDAARFAVIYGCGFIANAKNAASGWARGLESFWAAMGFESEARASLWGAFVRAAVTSEEIAEGMLDRCPISEGVVVVGYGNNGRAVVRAALRRGLPVRVRDDRVDLSGIETEPMGNPVRAGWGVLVTPLDDAGLRPRFAGPNTVFASEIQDEIARVAAWDLDAIVGERTPC